MSLEDRMNDIFDEVDNKIADIRNDLALLLDSMDESIMMVEKHPLEKTPWADLKVFINSMKNVSSTLQSYLEECECEDCEEK